MDQPGHGPGPGEGHREAIYHPDHHSPDLWKPFSRGHYAGKGPRAFKRSDERLREIVCDVLTDAPHIDPSDVEVTVKSGVVYLSGTVPDRRMKRMLEDSVEHIAGVMDIQNQITIRSLQHPSEPSSP